MNKFSVKDIEKAIAYLKKNYQTEIVIVEFDERNRLLVKATDMTGNAVTVVIFDESTSKFPETIKTERLM